MRIFKIGALALLLGSIFASCSNNLDETVYSEILDETYNYQPEDFASNIAGAYNPLRSDAQMYYWWVEELAGCCVVTPQNVTGFGGDYLLIHLHAWDSTLGYMNSIWSSYFQGVVLCNHAINRIERDVFPGITENDKLAGIAELRALRAFYYWRLMDAFGNIPLITTTSQEIPEQVSRKEIYEFLVNDLKEAIPSLSKDQDITTYGRFNEWAGRCLLANLYINAEVYSGTPQWEACIEQCDAIINGGKCELSPNFRDSFRTSGVENSKEVLMTIPYDYSKGVFANWMWMNAWHKELKKKFLTVGTPNEAGGQRAVPQYIDLYEEGDGRLDDTWLHGLQYDVEGNLLYGQYDMKGEPLDFTKELPDGRFVNEMQGYRVNKYEVEVGAQWSSSTDIPLMRYSEVLLMKAECLLRTGKTGAGALATEVRKRNFKNQEDAIVSDELLKKDSSFQWGLVENYKITDKGDQTPVEYGQLFDEWLREFAYECYSRRTMIRFGIFTKKSWLSHTPNGDFRAIYPIPEPALTANPKLKQNPGY